MITEQQLIRLGFKYIDKVDRYCKDTPTLGRISLAGIYEGTEFLRMDISGGRIPLKMTNIGQVEMILDLSVDLTPSNFED